MYEQYFERNYGILTTEEQERIRAGKVVIIGTGGIGGVVAVSLARSGLENFVLYEFDTYQPSNMNRQIACFTDTLGVNKAVVVADELMKINPQINIDLHTRGLEPEEIPDVIQQGDVILPAADNWPLSIVMLDTCIDMGVPAVMAYPVGALARVSTFMPDGPYASECLVMPYCSPYDELKIFMEDPANRQILQYYQIQGAWTQEWFDGFCTGELPHAQLCTPVWITGALAAMEMLKVISKKWEPVVAPRFWQITPTGAKIAKFSFMRRMLSRTTRRPWGKALLPALVKRPWLVRLFTRAIG
jgi:molybdopterin/thiamine biosynthesis adenylyltransferase